MSADCLAAIALVAATVSLVAAALLAASAVATALLTVSAPSKEHAKSSAIILLCAYKCNTIFLVRYTMCITFIVRPPLFDALIYTTCG